MSTDTNNKTILPVYDSSSSRARSSSRSRSKSIHGDADDDEYKKYPLVQSKSKSIRPADEVDDDDDDDEYKHYPLVQSLIETESIRTLTFTKQGSKQMNYPKSNEGWWVTLMTCEGRALDRILLPWIVVTLNSIIWTIVYEKSPKIKRMMVLQELEAKENLQGFLTIVLNTTMAFLLVFRLNRSATRFWMARQCWGIIGVRSRAIVSTVLVHGSHYPHHRDNVIRWVAAFSIASMNFVRGIKEIDPNCVAGILNDDELADLCNAIHPPLYSADMIRIYVCELFSPNTDADATTKKDDDDDDDGSNNNNNIMSLSQSYAVNDLRTQQLIAIEDQLNSMIDESGAMERIKGTPLPLVYVTHLRTWLMLFLLSMPYFWQSSLGYATIPVVFLTAFSLLGVEGAAEEVESPFRKNRTNHLDMDSFCLGILSNILQQTKHDADRRRRCSSKETTKKVK
jgi:putative membrane protein